MNVRRLQSSFLKRELNALLAFLPLFLLSLYSCHPHKKRFLQTTDSLIIINQALLNTIERASRNEQVEKIKVESGSRLILLDKYQDRINPSDTTMHIIQYARLHNDILKLDNKRDELHSLLRSQIVALKRLRSDIEASAWPDDSLNLFLAKEKQNITLLGESLLLLSDKDKQIQENFEKLHPAVSVYTDSLLKSKL